MKENELERCTLCSTEQKHQNESSRNGIEEIILKPLKGMLSF